MLIILSSHEPLQDTSESISSAQTSLYLSTSAKRNFPYGGFWILGPGIPPSVVLYLLRVCTNIEESTSGCIAVSIITLV